MADPLPDQGEDASTPRWVKVFGIVFGILVVLFVVKHLAGGGFRGHMPSGAAESGAHQP
ncbi:MAG TPA: hypothetical protein VGB85_17935 [Nannocystis sp.]|jgi:hypothetical protein